MGDLKTEFLTISYLSSSSPLGWFDGKRFVRKKWSTIGEQCKAFITNSEQTWLLHRHTCNFTASFQILIIFKLNQIALLWCPDLISFKSSISLSDRSFPEAYIWVSKYSGLPALLSPTPPQLKLFTNPTNELQQNQSDGIGWQAEN